MPNTISVENENNFEVNADTVDIAKTTRFTFLRVMESSSPVNGNITLVTTETSRALCQVSIQSWGMHPYP